jgi:uncharacterized membrane protein YeaQ/YmgE (transglycosylase-associated protein family)
MVVPIVFGEMLLFDLHSVDFSMNEIIVRKKFRERKNHLDGETNFIRREDKMEGVSLIGFLIVGLIAGWLGGKIMRGGGFGFFGNLVVGIVGAFVGGFLFRALGIIGFGFVGALVTATVGAVVLLFIVSLIKRA